MSFKNTAQSYGTVTKWMPWLTELPYLQGRVREVHEEGELHKRTGAVVQALARKPQAPPA